MFLQRKKEPETSSADVFFDAKEWHTSNREVASILANEGATLQEKSVPTVKLAEGNWGEEEEIDIDTEVMIDSSSNINTQGEGAVVEGSGDIFVPPSPGP
mmetsp:Transcript_21579/g.15789  ORF Transcript_21579/g.15789 Transcript_21579/m.15789 type:complete len:100 (+) Transcript_21579:1645-1944(+)